MMLLALFLGIAVLPGLVIAGAGMCVMLEDARQNCWMLRYAIVALILAVIMMGHDVYQLATTIIAATG